MITRFAVAGADEVDARQSLYVDLYRETLSRPPYGEGDEEARSFALELIGERRHRGFVSAELWAGDELAGFCTGYVGPPIAGDAWMEHAATLVAPADRHLIDAQWVVGWLVLAPRLQGAGHGAVLLDRLMRHSTTPHCWLITWPFDAPAVRLYENRGWRRLGAGPLGWRGTDRVIMAR